MRRRPAFFLMAFSAACAAQSRPASPAPSTAVSAPQTVYYADSDVVAPELIPPVISLEKIHPCKKLDGTPVISAIVDAKGSLSSLMVTQPADGNLNEDALALVAKDQFKPGKHDGVPATVAIQIEVELKTCRQNLPEENGAPVMTSFRGPPIQKVTVLPPLSPAIARAFEATAGGGVSAPVPLNAVTAHYTDAARKAKITGVCFVQVIVGADGRPRDPQVVKSLDPGLDQEALKAVLRYRFKPAMRKGQPVPVRITIEISFKLY